MVCQGSALKSAITMAPCLVTKAIIIYLLCAWAAPISRGSLLEKLIRSPDVKASPRRLDEDACVSLLKPHIPKVAAQLNPPRDIGPGSMLLKGGHTFLARHL